MSYTNEEILKRIEKAKNNKDKLTHITDKSLLSVEDKMKISLCKHFVQFIHENKYKIKDLSEIIDIPQSRLSEITNYKIKKFTVDQLIKNLVVLSKHAPKVKAYLDLIEEAVDVPTLSIAHTKRLTKGLRDGSIVNRKSEQVHA